MSKAVFYIILFGLDHLPKDEEIEQIIDMNESVSSLRVITLHVNLGPYRDILFQSSNVVPALKFRQAAQKEWQRKGFEVPLKEIELKKVILPDQSLFVLAGLMKA